MFIAHIASHAYLYRNLGKTANWADPITKHFQFKDDTQTHTFENVKAWSNSFNEFDNWVNLNSVMAMSSNLETYMSTVIKLALESDVGVLFGTSKRIDGIEIIKHGRPQPFDYEDKLMSCTKGEWGARVNAFERIFGKSPALLSGNISALEKLRKLRNNVGHAFGRDIDASRHHNVIDTLDIQKLKREKTLEYQKLMYGIAKSIDKQLLQENIGEYQTVYFYHNLRPQLNHEDIVVERRIGNHSTELKKQLGRFGAAKAGKKFCKELVTYYESL